MIVYRRLLTTHLHGKAAVVANKHLFKAIHENIELYHMQGDDSL